MSILAIDTATRRVGVGVGDARGLLASLEVGGPAAEGPPRHAEVLAPAIESVCARAGVAIRSLSAIAVSIGPGMFTGLRVGVTTAKALGHALGVPLIPVASLDLVAAPLRHVGTGLIVPMIDARRNEVYAAFYRPVPGGIQRVSDYLLVTPDDLAAELVARGEDALLCGDGCVRFRETFAPLDRCAFAGPGYDHPSLAELVSLASARFAREEFEPARAVSPMYLRKSDAELAATGSADGRGRP